MAAFVASILSIVFGKALGKKVSPTGLIPRPLISHVVLSKDLINKFNEVVVIGDVHGCYDDLLNLLKVIQEGTEGKSTSTDKILKIFVGDLVNKGPKSRQVLDLFMKNREDMLSVRGNHDEVVIDQYVNVIQKDPSSLRAKNEWMKELTQEEVDYLISLPYSIKIPSLNCIIIHAGLIPGVSLEDMNPYDLVTLRNIISKTDSVSGETILTPSKNTDKGVGWAKIWKGPEHVYFGHDARRKFQQEMFATGLDTGCVYGFDLTGVFIHGRRKGTLVKVSAAKPHVPVDD